MARQRSSEGGQSSKSSSKARRKTGKASSRAPSPSEAKIQFRILTLFPEVFPAFLNSSLLGKAIQRGLVSFSLTQIRDFANDKHRTVDDTPYGGGEGMVMKADVLYDAWKSAKSPEGDSPGKTITLFVSPQGKLFDQEMAKELSREYSKIILVCGHYEGVDERFVELCVDREVSVGDYVLTGGELPALIISDAVTRLIPGVVGNEQSVTRDSLEGGLLKYPQYTRPREFMGKEVPEVLLGGNHRAIETWREAQSRQRTERKRPDLWERLREPSR